MSIAGSDSSSGAGIQADVKTLQSLGGYCFSVVTSVTAQNSQKVSNIYNLPVNIINSQLKCIVDEVTLDSIKIGLINSEDVALQILKTLKRKKIPIVIDPIYKSTTGTLFLNKKNYIKIQKLLLNICTLVTPGIFEAEILIGQNISNISDMKKACELISNKFKISVFLKGSDFKKNIVTDVLFDKNEFYLSSYKNIITKNTHGSGCTLSSSIAYYLGKGMGLKESIINSKKNLLKSIRNSPDLNLEYGPIGH